jgi:hypothetical protein
LFTAAARPFGSSPAAALSGLLTAAARRGLLWAIAQKAYKKTGSDLQSMMNGGTARGQKMIL